MPGHYGNRNGNGNGMRTMRGRAATPRRGRAVTQRRGRAATPRRGRAATPRRGRMMNGNGRMMNGNGRMMNGTGARGVRRTTGQFGRGGVRRATTRRPAPVMRRGRTQPMMRNQTPARGRMTSGQGNHGFRGVDSLGHNI
jgi:hypothetical protein